MRNYSLLLVVLLCFACAEEKETVDLLIINANIYTVNQNFDTAEAMAISDGKIIATGTTKDIQEKYTSLKVINTKGMTIFPGLIDAHCHFYNLGVQQQAVDLVGTKSFDEVVQRIVDFQKKKNVEFITGRGWDQNDWQEKSFPVKDTLDQLFPNTPLAITRIDGHAMLVNQKALDMAKITTATTFTGGDIEQKNGKLTGIIVDKPMGLIRNVIPALSKEQSIAALLDAQEICTNYGLTTVDDAGLSRDVVALIDSLQQNGALKTRMYAMMSNTPTNLDYYLDKGIIKTDRLNIRSFKAYADGALGSRGAVLKEPYSDKENHFGAMVIGVNEFKDQAKRIAASQYQLNTHAIGDSANAVVLRTYAKLLDNTKDRRWRVEHAQIVAEEDFKYYNENIITSIQPTHATSDMYWAENRVGKERMPGAYAYQRLLKQSGRVALGTDFPVEQVSPFLTFYAAVARKDLEDYPKEGFQMQDALSREDALRGMTIWAAYSNFEEDEKGSLEPGKFADFIVLDQDIMKVDIKQVPKTKVLHTFINGEQLK
ncbi:amidohydrolase [Gangjinia marincola]|uniref:Amidohydrolase n=1 Tax=Gangjinia marincola TaxID=578463 RepID=A0ABN1MDQ1_9FLAO